MKTEDAKKIIATAIDREVEAYTFYRTVGDKVKDPALKKLFAELAGEEKQHREFLQGMLSKDVTKMHFDAKQDYKVVNTAITTFNPPSLLKSGNRRHSSRASKAPPSLPAAPATTKAKTSRT